MLKYRLNGRPTQDSVFTLQSARDRHREAHSPGVNPKEALMKNPAGHLRTLATALVAAVLLSDCGGGGGYGGGSGGGVTYPAPVLGDLVITEVMAQPAGTSPATKEWFEVLNKSPNTLPLDGMGVTVNT